MTWVSSCGAVFFLFKKNHNRNAMIPSPATAAPTLIPAMAPLLRTSPPSLPSDPEIGVGVAVKVKVEVKVDVDVVEVELEVEVKVELELDKEVELSVSLR